MSQTKTFEKYEPVIEEDTAIALPFNVTLFNDDIHTFNEVIDQLIKAINCSFTQARSYAFEVHVKGKAVVFKGDLQNCLKVSSILEEIGLHTQVTAE
ncbi:MAG: ATP-dependent Clp protease adaptor ClpS [Ignavibacteria bacterium]|nr:ATP-dependent Clp protease adaptor ClpS [Ignavibacteria bacterium]